MAEEPKPFDAVAQIDKRLEDLRMKLAARKNKTAFRHNVPAIQAEINRLEGTREMIVQAREMEHDL